MIRALVGALLLALLPAPAEAASFEGRLTARLDARYSPCADRYAEGWARYLARTHRFYHHSMSRLLRVCRAHWAGEVMAMHVTSPRQAMRLWRQSPPHRAVLRQPYTKAGVGAVRLNDGTYLVVVDLLR